MLRTDQQLIADYHKEDEQALALLIDRYMRAIYSFSYRLTGNADDAQDVTQESFVKMWKHLHAYRPEQSFRAWIFRIAHNTAIDLLRKKKGVPLSYFDTASGENVLENTSEDPAPLPDELLTQAENKKLLDSLLDQLAPTAREVLVLHYEHELTFDEIGSIVGRPLNTVKSQHRRALAQLRLSLMHAPQ